MTRLALLAILAIAALLFVATRLHRDAQAWLEWADEDAASLGWRDVYTDGLCG